MEITSDACPGERLMVCRNPLLAADRARKRLGSVERAFRSLKTVDLKVRPVFHRTEPRVRTHVLLCMLACYVEWHMRQKLKPMLFDDEDVEGAELRRRSIVASASASMSARDKAVTRTTPDGDPVQLPYHHR